METREADFCGRLEKRWNWRTFRFEWGRMCYQTDCTGATLDRWFEFEKARVMEYTERARRLNALS